VNLFIIISLLGSAATFYLGFSVFKRDVRNPLNLIFFLFCLSVTYICFFDYAYRQAYTYDEAFYWLNAWDLWIFSIPLELHFVLLLTGKRRLANSIPAYFLLYAPGFLFFWGLERYLSYEPLMTQWGWAFKISPQEHPVIALLDVWILLLGVFTIMASVYNYRKAGDGIKKHQALYVMTGVTISTVFASVSLEVLPALGVTFPDISGIGYILEIFCMGYAIWRYELFAITPAAAAESIISTMTDALVLASSDGKIAKLNQAAEGFFGEKENEMRGRHISAIFPEREHRTIREVWDKILEGSVPTLDIETHFTTGKDREIPISLSGSALRDRDGTERGIVLVARDLTERVQANRRLQKAQKMESLGTLAGAVAHDLNNILSGIVSYPDLLLKQLPEDSPMRKPVMTIMESGKKAADMVQDLLTLTRRGVSTSTVVELNEIITNYLKGPEYEELLRNHPYIQVLTDLEEPLMNIMGSPVHLMKAIMNLIVNAAEAMPEGGKIRISSANRYLDAPLRGDNELKEGEYVTVTIADGGVGISTEDQERIFEPFYTKKVMGRSGTGLGMSVVWGTVKDHQGYIKLESGSGEGTTFTLYFPATRQEQPHSDKRVSIEEYRGHGQSILVIDDIEEQREIASRILIELGYVVETVSDGKKAIELLRDRSFDLLILDMIMEPGMDGLDTYKEILRINPEQKAIVASGFSETERVKEARRLGAVQYIKKPYTLETIGEAVRVELDR